MAKREMRTNNIEPMENVNVENETPEVTEDVKKENKIGVVSNCSKLNVRKKPVTNAKVLTILDMGNEVEIVEDESTEDFYRVVVTKIPEKPLKGFCMKEYIKIK